MISSLKYWKFKQHLRSHPNFNKNTDKKSINKGSTILILSDTVHKDYVEKLARKLSKDQRSVDIIYFSEDNVESSSGNIITRKNTNWYGIPQEDTIDKILQKDYDILMYLKFDMRLTDEYCLQLAKSNLNIGPNISKASNFFHLVIDLDADNIEVLIRNILVQLKNLSTSSI